MNLVKKYFYKLGPFCFLLVTSVQASEETLAGVAETQRLLKSSDSRKEAIKESKSATETDQYVKQLSGNLDNEQLIYELAAEVMGNMKDLSPEQMSKIIELAKKDPKGFAATWTPEQKKKLRMVTDRLPSSTQKSP